MKDYDIVYFVKDWPVNNELTYSLRSVEQNWPCRKIWFSGGCPDNLRPDVHIRVQQTGKNKWEKVRSMIRKVCLNDEISEKFWLFNDDFFILKRFEDTMEPQYYGELADYVEEIIEKHGHPSDYTERLCEAIRALKKAGLSTYNYEIHKPMLIDRSKALEVLDVFLNVGAFRSLYGNYYKICGVNKYDAKIRVTKFDDIERVDRDWEFLSTDDQSFMYGNIGEYIRLKFKKRSRFET